MSSLDPLSVHNHFKSVEVKISPEIDWYELSDVEDIERLFKPRIDRASRLASGWERHLLEEAYRMGVWRLWVVQWCEYTETAAFMNTRVFPPWGIKQAQRLSKKVGEDVVGLSLKKWILMDDGEFVRESGSSPNFDVMVEMRRVLGARCRRKCK
jgi:hypothetical protein